MSDLPRVYDVTGLLKHLDGVISRNKLYEELESGRLAATRIGAKWLIPEPNVLAWLDLDVEDGADVGSGTVTPIDSVKNTEQVSND